MYTIVKDRETFYRRHTVPVTSCSEVKYVLKRVSLGSKGCTKELKLECAYFLDQIASFCHLGVISDPLIVSKFHNETHDPKGQENKMYTIVKDRETFYRRHTVPVTSCSEVKYVLRKGIPWKQRLHQRTETSRSVHISWARLASFCHLGVISDPLIVSKLQIEIHDPKGQENKIYTTVKGRETFYCRHTVPVTSCSEVKYVFNKGIPRKRRLHQRTKTRVCIFPGPDLLVSAI